MNIWMLSKREHLQSYAAKRFVEEAQRKQINLEYKVPDDFDIIVTKDGKKSIHYEGKPVDLPDCLIPRMGAGTTYFALAIIRHLELQGVLVLNPSNSIEICKDKLATIQYLAESTLPFPKTMVAKFPLDTKFIEKEFSYPIIIKAVSGSHGKGVFLAENRNKLEDMLHIVELAKDTKINLILQEYMKKSKGKDVRVLVVGGKVIGAMMRKAPKGGFKANVTAGGTSTGYKIDPTLEWLSVEAARILNLDIAGVDLLFAKHGYAICEVNSAPGFRGFESATKLNVPDIILDYVAVRLNNVLE